MRVLALEMFELPRDFLPVVGIVRSRLHLCNDGPLLGKFGVQGEEFHLILTKMLTWLSTSQIHKAEKQS